jgi:polyhydroxyalkanoate synthase subunit PhaE
MNAMNDGWPKDFDAISRQYWNAWSEMSRHAGSGHQQHIPGWQDAMDMWAPWARDGRAQTDDTISRMNAQTGEWFGKMQELAKSLSGGQSGPGEIASAWKKALGIEAGFSNSFSNPFANMFQQMTGPDAHGIDQWMRQIAPWLDTMRGQGMSGFPGMNLNLNSNMPAFGMGREHQERMQALQKSLTGYQQAMQGYNAQLMECGQRAFAKFEDKLAERSEPGRQIDSARALFDLWIDAAEEAWGEIAMTAEFRTAYGSLVNAQSRVRAGVQDQVERLTGMFGMPSRTEVNSSHKKVHQLERELRALKQRLAALESSSAKVASPVRKDDDVASEVASKKPATKPAATKPAAPTARRSK